MRFLILIFTFTSLFLMGSVTQVLATEPIDNLSPWKLVENWHKNSDESAMIATLQADIKELGCQKEMSLEFPTIMHARQEIELDGKLISDNGNDFYIRSIYGAPVIDCNILASGSITTWKITAFVNAFANLKHLPEIRNSDAINRTEVFHLISFGANFIVVFFLLVSTLGTTFFRQAILISSFCIFMGLFLMLSVFGLLGFKVHYLTIDRLACISIGFSIITLFSFLKERNLIAPKIAIILNGLLGLANVLFCFINDGDLIQNILNFIFIPSLLNVWFAVYMVSKNLKVELSLKNIISFLALASFATSTTSDILFTYGVHHWGMSIGFGFTGTALFFAILLQTEIYEMNRERDYLKNNLQKEVSNKTTSLEKALSELKTTQADLIQSARLASLGTLSAGIAHEINNSINYVNGALSPLEKRVMKFVPDEEKEKLKKLFEATKAGTELTISIVKSLRTYTGLNQSPIRDVNLHEVTESVLTILRSRLKEIEVENNVPENIHMLGYQVGISQILMNLISNAIDAVKPGQGKIAINAKLEPSDNVSLSISDNGSGIPDEIQQRIFDPFFTTKEVGKGTGLGMHIVKNEVDRHEGKIHISSTVGVGTTFTLQFPLKPEIISQEAS